LAATRLSTQRRGAPPILNEQGTPPSDLVSRCECTNRGSAKKRPDFVLWDKLEGTGKATGVLLPGGGSPLRTSPRLFRVSPALAVSSRLSWKSSGFPLKAKDLVLKFSSPAAARRKYLGSGGGPRFFCNWILRKLTCVLLISCPRWVWRRQKSRTTTEALYEAKNALRHAAESPVGNAHHHFSSTLPPNPSSRVVRQDFDARRI